MICSICGSQMNTKEVAQFDGASYTCTKCGDYEITGTAESVIKATPLPKRQAANASGWIREHPGVRIYERDLNYFRTLRSPTMKEKATKILLELDRKIESSMFIKGIDINFSSPVDVAYWQGISWSANFEELRYLLVDWLESHAGFITGLSDMSRTYFRNLRITPQGYEYLDSIAHPIIESKMGFCAMWFDKRLNAVWDDAISPAIKDAGYEPKRVDRHEHNNKIDDEIVSLIRQSRFVVSDLTGNRGGVYFEAGLALGLSIPVIWTVREAGLHKVHFDNRQYNFLIWSRGNLKEFKDKLENRIVSTIGKGDGSERGGRNV